MRSTLNSRPASAQPPQESQAVTEMRTTLADVPLSKFKLQMVAAGVPGADETDWKEDLITLAV